MIPIINGGVQSTGGGGLHVHRLTNSWMALLDLSLNNDDVTVIPLQDFLVPLSICLHVEVMMLVTLFNYVPMYDGLDNNCIHSMHVHLTYLS